ncbi:MAG: SDR family oxidoreductase [Rhodospirillaceae bacterium]|nr:SDR family oxidoreductase [Rhodospirillaceae bacterium]
MSAERQVAIVTGGASGIGLATVLRLAEDGFAVAAVDRNAGALETARQRAAAGLAVTWHAADVTDRAAIKAVVDAQPRVDVAVCAAGVHWLVPLRDVTEEQFRQMLDVNLIGAFICAQECIRRMGAGGRVILISSRAALGSGAGSTAYVASKAGVVGLTRAMAMELRKDRIAVNSVAPGFTDTAMTRSVSPEQFAAYEALEPFGKAAQPAEIANAVAFFASPRTSFVTGQTLFVDGGKSLGGLGI